jgi:hypothetical protein
MKRIIFTGVLLFASVAGEALAVCDTGHVDGLNALLVGNTVCGSNVGNTEQYQEEHHGNATVGEVVGALWDYKLGNGDAVDPRVPLGTWTLTNDSSSTATVTYLYNRWIPNATKGPFSVYKPDPLGTKYEFCSGTTLERTATIVPTGDGSSRVCPPNP